MRVALSFVYWCLLVYIYVDVTVLGQSHLFSIRRLKICRYFAIVISVAPGNIDHQNLLTKIPGCGWNTLPKIETGFYRLQFHPQLTTEESRAYIQCYGDYKLSGSPLITCDTNGVWSSPRGACNPVCECPCTEQDYKSRRLTLTPGSSCRQFFQCAPSRTKRGTYCWTTRNCLGATLFDELNINGLFTGRCNHAYMVQCKDDCTGPCPCH